MTPRLKSSAKWTPLPKELTKQVHDIFTENFKKEFKKGDFNFEGRIYKEELMLSFEFLPTKALRAANFEISIGYKRTENVMQLLHTALDCGASLMESYFQGEDTSNFPVQWQEIDFEGKKLFIQFNTENKELESKADKLLGIKAEDAHSLVSGDEADEETLKNVITMLGLDDDEDGKKKH